MCTHQRVKPRALAGWASCLAAALLMALPAMALATDISWKSTMTSGTAAGGKFTRVGQALMSTGETAEVKIEGTDGAADEKGRYAVAVDTVMQFKDGSSIATRYKGWRDPKTQEVAGSGQFVSGTGRFQGITGTFTYQGLSGRSEFVGAYELRR